MTRASTMTRAAIERELLEDLDDTELRLVWADLLLAEGDPLGRLVLLEHTAQTTEGEVAQRARAEVDALRKELAGRLWTKELPKKHRRNRGVELRWHLGFVRELVIVTERLGYKNTPERSVNSRDPAGNYFSGRVDTAAFLLPKLLAQPALRWLQTIRIVAPDHEAGNWLYWGVRSAHSPSLRELHVGDPAQVRERPGGMWESSVGGSNGHAKAPELEFLATRFPRLHRASMSGERIRVACCRGPSKVRTRHVQALLKHTGPLCASQRASLIRGLWDESSSVRAASFELAQRLGPDASFLIDDLLWFLRPPVRPKDPRPESALRTLAAIGPASAPALRKVLFKPAAVRVNTTRREAFMDWLAVLGPAAAPARRHVDATLAEAPGSIPETLRATALRAREALDEL